jgi:hypothetical protein
VQYYTVAHSRHSYYEAVLGVIIYLRSAEIRVLDVSGRRWMEIDDMNDLGKAEYMFCPEGRYDFLSATGESLPGNGIWMWGARQTTSAKFLLWEKRLNVTTRGLASATTIILTMEFPVTPFT